MRCSAITLKRTIKGEITISADNGIYIAKFPDGYRVIYAQAIDNLWYYPDGSEEQLTEIKNYFEYAPVYDTRESAILAAYGKAKEYDMLEYGVSEIGELPLWRGVLGDTRKILMRSGVDPDDWALVPKKLVGWYERAGYKKWIPIKNLSDSE